MKKILLMASGGLSFLLCLIFLLVIRHLGNSLPEQQMAERWSEEKDVSQVSCFFSVDAKISEEQILNFEYSLENALKEASIVQESANPGARLWADAYSAGGKVTIASDKTSMEADAIGIGGDFFLFHPLKLLSGSYFSGRDVNRDYCVIDQDAAWQLFGSNDVAGMTVYIGNVPHVITGVVERASGRLAERAGLDGTVVYVSLNTLNTLGTGYGINHYEVVMPNPVSGFAYELVKKDLGTDEQKTDVIENTKRFDFLSTLRVIGAFGTRSMSGKAILYPYWENLARGYEDMISVWTLILLTFMVYPVVMLITLFVLWWKNKKWTLESVHMTIFDRIHRYLDRRRERRKEEKTD